MLEAMWAVYFVNETNSKFGAGIIVLENGLIRGGDSSYYYLGNYRVKDDIFYAEVDVNHYFGQKNNISGPYDKVKVTLTGRYAYETFTLHGESIPIVNGQPVGLNQPTSIALERIAEITR